MSPSSSILTAADRLRKVANLLSADVDGEVVMMDVDRGVYFALDPIGSDIWSRLDQPASASELAANLVQDYEADVATIEADVLALFQRLLDRGLVELA